MGRLPIALALVCQMNDQQSDEVHDWTKNLIFFSNGEEILASYGTQKIK